MYLVGAVHPYKTDAQLILERLVAGKVRLVCDAEVLQENLHRYVAIDRRKSIDTALGVLLGLVDEALPIERSEVMRAVAIVSGPGKHGTRDAIQLAVMERYGISSIVSFDRDFARWPGIVRIFQA